MKKFFFLYFLLNVFYASAQRYELLSGKLEHLKTINEYNITFDYKDLEVNGFESEQAYLQEKIQKRKNYDGGKDLQDKAGKFEKSWYSDREEKYEPGFIDYFNDRLEAYKIVAGKKPDAKYTMDINTTWVYPGYELANVEPAKLSAIITVFETADSSNVLVAVKFDKLIGIVKNYRNQGDRIKGAYERLAKDFTIQLKRFL